MAVKFQLRRDTAANWTAANTVLDLGEPGFETDTRKLKMGDGTTPWNSLDYTIIQDFAELSNIPTTLAGYGITDAATSAQGALADTALQPGDGLAGDFSGDVKGSVFADDSTILVDGVAAKINLSNNSITDLSDANQTLRTNDDVEFNKVTTNSIDTGDSSAITMETDVVMLAGLTVGNHIVPSSDEQIDIGTAVNRFNDIYLSGNTIDLGGALITKQGNGIQLPAGSSIEGENNIAAPDQSLNTTDNVTFANITTTGYIAGPATMTIDPAAVGDNTGVLVIAGDLQVDGTTTTINSTTVEVDDLNIQLATGSVNRAAANGAGITVDLGSDGTATINYDGTNNEWDFNKKINVSGQVNASGSIIGPSGSAASPTFTVTDNTGLYSTGDDALGLATNSTQRFGITSDGDIQFYERNGGSPQVALHWDYFDGQLGIGETAPDSGISANQAGLHIKDANVPYVSLDNTGTFGRKFTIYSNTQGKLVFYDNDASTSRITLINDGKIGIGYDTPADNIHILGDNTNPNVGITLQADDTVNAEAAITFIARNASNVAQTHTITADDQTLKIDPVSGVAIGVAGTPSSGTKLEVEGEVSGNWHTILKNTHNSNGFGLKVLAGDDADTVAFRVTDYNNNQLFDVRSDGFVGINETAPSTKLHVHGTGYADSALTLSRADTTSFTGSLIFEKRLVDGVGDPAPLVTDDTVMQIYSQGYHNTTGDFGYGPEIIAKLTADAVDGENFEADLIFQSPGNVRRLTLHHGGDATLAGKLSAEDHILAAIDTDITGTANHVFVYDTRLDIDGGAWRHRTQGTTWYNEELNTSIRGSRREFPSVVVIVATGAAITFYDADDPDMPMWMVWEDTGVMGWASGTVPTANPCVMKNGVFVWGTTSRGSGIANFISDDIRIGHQVTPYYLDNRTIGNRADGSFSTGADGYILLHPTVNDIAITFLKDAPIDPNTGLPKPTIAFAGSNGVNVLRDDGNDITIEATNYTDISDVLFDDEGYLYFTSEIGTYDGNTINKTAIPTTNEDSAFWSQNPSFIEQYDPKPGTHVNNTGTGLTLGDRKGIAYSSDTYGLTLIEDTETTEEKAIKAFIGSNFNTGWIHGDIKAATLNSNDATNAVGGELLYNGDFSNGDLDGWTFSGDGSEYSYSTGTMADGSTTGQSFFSALVTVTVGKTYVASFLANGGGGTPTVAIDDSNGIPIKSTTVADDNGTVRYYQITFVPGAGQTQVRFRGSGQAWTGYYDNFSIKLAEDNWASYKDSAFQVNGTVTKTAVATGADLVAYSGFSSGSIAGNYIQQPFNDTHSPGTGDFLYSFWINAAASSNETFIDHSGEPNATTNPRLRIHAFNATSGILRVYIADGSVTPLELQSTLAAANSTWNQVVVVREAGTVKIYINGELDATAAWAGDMTRTGGQIRLGLDGDGTDPLSGSLSLFRYGFTIPTAEQIKKIYEDERKLFYPGAQATLEGTSDNVVAIDYDNAKKQLRAGTSGGTSVFEGLRRVESTTNAVTAALSVQNGLAAEE